MKRKQNSQAIAWFWDVYKRDRLELNAPYQRRSVWNQAFKDHFIDTILQDYPAPAIFLYEEISTLGVAQYSVVDGKQRLTAIFEFADNKFPVPDNAEKSKLRGMYFGELDDEIKRAFWGYQFSVEYLPSDDEGIIKNIFDRINRNTANLSAQELRHAKFSGVFISAAERLSDWMTECLPRDFPNIPPMDRKRMKDDEFVAQLLLLTELGPRGYYRDLLDEAFSERESEWNYQNEAGEKFRKTIKTIANIVDKKELKVTRLRNQTDFYALFGAVNQLIDSGELPEPNLCASRLKQFTDLIISKDHRKQVNDLSEYYELNTSSGQTKQRKCRINILKRVLMGETKGLEDI